MKWTRLSRERSKLKFATSCHLYAQIYTYSNKRLYEHTRIVDLDPAKAYYTFSVSDRGKLLMLDFILLNLRPNTIYSSLFNLQSSNCHSDKSPHENLYFDSINPKMISFHMYGLLKKKTWYIPGIIAIIKYGFLRMELSELLLTESNFTSELLKRRSFGSWCGVTQNVSHKI